MQQTVGQHTLNEVAQVQRNLIQEMNLLFDVGVYHGDIKNTNVMINPQTKDIKYIDFEFASLEENGVFIWALEPDSTPDILSAPQVRADTLKILGQTIIRD